MSDAVQHMRSNAEHFARGDWEYTRDTGDLSKIVYKSRGPWYRRLGRRIKDSVEWLFAYPKWARVFDGEMGPLRRIAFRFEMFWHALTHQERNLPDGKVGAIYTFWEEDGEYIQMMQPSVGLLVADFLEAEPDHPHAVKIRAEMQRLLASYIERNQRPREES